MAANNLGKIPIKIKPTAEIKIPAPIPPVAPAKAAPAKMAIKVKEGVTLPSESKETKAPWLPVDAVGESVSSDEGKGVFLDEQIENYSWKADGVYVNQAGETYLLPNNKQFGNWINKKYKMYKSTGAAAISSCGGTSGKKDMFSYQKFVRDYMRPQNPYRGMLVYQSPGLGKTRIAVATSEQYRAQGIKVIVFLPASLKPTWMNEIKKWGNDDIRYPSNYESLTAAEKAHIDNVLDQRILASYSFISYNASNTLDQLKKVVGGDQLKGKFVVADEAHNLLSMMVNPKGKKGYKLYRTMMDAIDCKFLFLSGTPILNSPFEVAIMYNILKGYMQYKGIKHTLFPEDMATFIDYFVDYDTKKIRNPELFKRRIIGMTSYYYEAKGGVYPNLVINPPTEIEFSDYQFKQYAKARLAEMEKEKKKQSEQKMANLSKAAKATGNLNLANEVSSTFRIFSRQFSNFVYPEKIKRPMPHDYSGLVKLNLNPNPSKWNAEQKAEVLFLFDGDQTEYDKFIVAYADLKNDLDRLQFLQDTIEQSGKTADEFANIISDEEQFMMHNVEVPTSYEEAIQASLKLLDEKADIYFDQLLPCLSGKMEVMYRNIMEGPGSAHPAYVYSQFRTLEGVGIFARVLGAHGFEALNYHSINATNIASYANEGKMRYVVYSGDEDNVTRNKILWIFNHPLNINGSICKVFMGTSASVEGISLKNTCQVHIMEPYWNEVRIQQGMGRARRICSHSDLPVDEQFVYVFRYHMTLSAKQKKEFPEATTTDQEIYRIAKIKEEVNNQFLQILKDAAVDCYLNAADNITPINPISCFSFDEKETGIAFYPSLTEEKSDSLASIHYKQEQISFATFNVFGPDDARFFAQGDYLYVYKYSGNPTIIKKEKIWIASKNKFIMATVLYDKTLAKNGNMFMAKKALVENTTAGKTSSLVLPATAFTVSVEK